MSKFGLLDMAAATNNPHRMVDEDEECWRFHRAIRAILGAPHYLLEAWAWKHGVNVDDLVRTLIELRKRTLLAMVDPSEKNRRPFYGSPLVMARSLLSPNAAVSPPVGTSL
jgi:hypothetical protein